MNLAAVYLNLYDFESAFSWTTASEGNKIN